MIAAARELMQAAVRSGRRPRQVYRRRGEPCPRCGTPIRSAGQGDANRTTYLVPALPGCLTGSRPVGDNRGCGCMPRRVRSSC